MTPEQRLLDAVAGYCVSGGASVHRFAVANAHRDWRASLASADVPQEAAPLEARVDAPRPEWVRALPGCSSWFTARNVYGVHRWLDGRPLVRDDQGDAAILRAWEPAAPPAPAQPEPTPDALRRAWEAGRDAAVAACWVVRKDKKYGAEAWIAGVCVSQVEALTPPDTLP